MKLPAFYVLDAISKNINDPYAAKFSAFVVPLFLEAYGQVDVPTRGKMEEMLVTWRTGNPSGKELFGIAAQVSLERQIWGQDASSMESVRDLSYLHLQQAYANDFLQASRRRGQAPLNKSQVLAELDVTLALKEQVVQANPYDQTAATQASVLHQVCSFLCHFASSTDFHIKLRRVIERGVSQEELQQILVQLRTMGRELIAPAVPVPHSIGPITRTSVPQSMQPEQAPSSSYPVAVVQTQGSSTSEPSTSNAAPNILGITNLFESLVKAGLVSANSTPRGAGLSSQSPPPAPASQDNSSTIVPKDESDRSDAQRAYAREILKMPIRLTTADIGRYVEFQAFRSATDSLTPIEIDPRIHRRYTNICRCNASNVPSASMTTAAAKSRCRNT